MRALSTIPSPSLSHANHVDRQGPGLSYYADYVDQLTHRRQLQLVMAVIRVCFEVFTSPDPNHAAYTLAPPQLVPCH
jgi:hypothetical protein